MLRQIKLLDKISNSNIRHDKFKISKEKYNGKTLRTDSDRRKNIQVVRQFFGKILDKTKSVLEIYVIWLYNKICVPGFAKDMEKQNFLEELCNEIITENLSGWEKHMKCKST